MDIFSLISDQLSHARGWRFYTPLCIVGTVGAIIHFSVGWNEATTTVMIVLTLVGTLAGLLWQHQHDADS